MLSSRLSTRLCARLSSMCRVNTRSFASIGTDEEIARAATMQPITQIAAERCNMTEDQLELYGNYKAKVFPGDLAANPDGKLILVTAISPTKAGEGKTTTLVGLVDGLCKIGKNAMCALREPSLGPVFGMKGGAAGGGYAQVVPMDEINLHFTGDMHAIGAAHNLLSALVDNHIKWKKEPLLDPVRTTWGRVVDMNDRALRDIVVGLGGLSNGVPRQDGFDITVASEVMACFCLSTDLADLQQRLAKIIVGFTSKLQPVTAKDLNADGAMAALLSKALNPNLVQTLEHNPAFVHGGPFANIAHGCNSAIATKTALKMADYVVTEAGFGADLGAEKFFNIKCRKTGLAPDCVVLVATVRAIKMHGGQEYKDLKTENVEAVKNGLDNMKRHISNCQKFGMPVLVAINQFPTDTEAEMDALMRGCRDECGADIVLSNHFEHGGNGATEFAERVVKTIEDAEGKGHTLKLLYPDDMDLASKIETVAKELYGAEGVAISSAAAKKLKRFEKLGAGTFPICMAKTQYSFSADASVLGAPTGHVMPVEDVRLSAGAEFVVALTGSVMTMPGLPKKPAAEGITVDAGGDIHGLF